MTATPSLTVVSPDVEPVEVPHEAVVSHEAFRRWVTSDSAPQKGKITWIAGKVLIDMSPEDLARHGLIKSEIAAVIGGLVRAHRLGILFVDNALVTHLEASVSNVPDAVFASWDSLKSGRVKRVHRQRHPDEISELEGSPDWIVEIVSRSSIKKDNELLYDAYHRAGLREYWLINPIISPAELQLLIADERGWRRSTPDDDGFAASAIFGHRFRLTTGRDELGELTFTLDMR